jgi:hypothetical protein
MNLKNEGWLENSGYISLTTFYVRTLNTAYAWQKRFKMEELVPSTQQSSGKVYR